MNLSLGFYDLSVGLILIPDCWQQSKIKILGKMYYTGVQCFSMDIIGKKCALRLRVHSSPPV